MRKWRLTSSTLEGAWWRLASRWLRRRCQTTNGELLVLNSYFTLHFEARAALDDREPLHLAAVGCFLRTDKVVALLGRRHGVEISLVAESRRSHIHQSTVGEMVRTLPR